MLNKTLVLMLLGIIIISGVFVYAELTANTIPRTDLILDSKPIATNLKINETAIKNAINGITITDSTCYKNGYCTFDILKDGKLLSTAQLRYYNTTDYIQKRNVIVRKTVIEYIRAGIPTTKDNDTPIIIGGGGAVLNTK